MARSARPKPPPRAPAAPDESAALAALAMDSAAPFTASHPYFADAEPHMVFLWNTTIAPFIQGTDFRRVIDLACGHGRNSELLRRHAGELILMDLMAENIEVCRRRFAEATNIAYVVNDGSDFRPVEAGSVTHVYCFDAMVHFDSDVVRAYLRDLRRVLTPGGTAFLHHSNYTGGEPWLAAPSNRNFMSAALFAHYARKEGLVVTRQKLIGWGADSTLDCLSLLTNP